MGAWLSYGKKNIDMNDFFEIWERLTLLWRKPEQGALSQQEKQMLRLQFEIRRAMRKLNPWTYDVDKAWQKVRPRRTRRVMVFVGKCAAVLALGVFSLYLLSRLEREPQHLAQQTESVVEEGGIELRLATGERLLLDSYQGAYLRDSSGVEIENDTATGKLSYRDQGMERENVLKWNTLVVPKGMVYTLELSDGTQIWINSESSLRFPERFGGAQREVFVEGEIYLEVAHNEAWPFVVSTPSGRVTVLGTAFNVRAYRSEEEEQVTLASGKVKIDYPTASRSLMLSPEEQSVWADGKIEKRRVNPALYCSWHEGKWLFENCPLEDIMALVARRYNVSVVWEEDALRTMTFSGEIRHFEQVESVLRILELADDIAFSMENGEIRVCKSK